MQDSLQALQRRLHEMNTAFTSLQGEAEGLVERVNDFETVQVQTEDLSKTLTKMEDKELRAIVQQLDPEVLATLYKQASGRNRTRLLQALPPTQAAQFVHRLTGASAPTYQNASLPVDTTATAAEVPSAENALLDE
jgi:flagellar motility protein MotE (MotC chaperone)